MDGGTAAVKRGRKFDQVLDGAREVFLRDGFERASTDDIARVAGVSKATLYAYFPDKRQLFVEVMRSECLRRADAAIEMIDFSQPPVKVLRQGALQIIGYLLSDFGQRMHRIMMAECDRHPDLCAQYYEAGPALARDRISEYLRAACARGDLAIDDIELAADQFGALCHAWIHDRVFCAVQREFSAAEIARVVEGAVATFLARYGVR